MTEGFGPRLGLLLLLLVVAAAGDRWRHGAEARRWREYLLLLLFGGLGAVFGLASDQVTSRLSPDYFIHGKGLDAGPDLGRQVVVLSLQAGLVAGLVLGGVLLLANDPRPDRPGLPAAALVRLAAWPAALAALLAPVGFLALGALDPLGLDRELRGLVDDPAARARFVQVWGAHAGLYAGGLLGVVVAAVLVRRRRPRVAPASP